MERRLIEVDFPLREVSEQSVREKNIRQGHISTLHIWWARRPLAVSRATALAGLLPYDSERHQDYIDLIKHLAPWEAVARNGASNPDLQRASQLIRESFDDRAPKVLDCFAGGGAIPLEALRLGCEAYALDYNPVAVLILKAVLEYPQKFGRGVSQTADGTEGALGLETRRMVNPLLDAVKRWGSWVLQEAHEELERFYPSDPDGSIPVGYIWAHTVPCQNPSCGVEIPTMRQTWLANKAGRKIALRMVPNHAEKQVDFEIADGEGIEFDPEHGTVSQAHVRCPLCGGTIDGENVRRLFREGRANQRMIAVALQYPGKGTKIYRLPRDGDVAAYRMAAEALRAKSEALRAQWGIAPVPDEPLPRWEVNGKVAYGSGMRLLPYGFRTWGDLFNARQKLALVTLAEKVREVYVKVLSSGGDANRAFACAVATYLALGMSRVADYMSELCVHDNTQERTVHVFGRQILPMVWDYSELNPLSDAVGSWVSMFERRILSTLRVLINVASKPAVVVQGSATALPWPDNYFDAVLTDPPYYDNVPYADLSDFFYVWLKRALGDLHPDLFATPLSPKSDEIVDTAELLRGIPKGMAKQAGIAVKDREDFERMLGQGFSEIARVLRPDGIAVIVFAHKATGAWEAVINALLKAGLFMTASWPIHTEMEIRLRARESAALASSIYMVCRKRTTDEVGEFSKVRKEIEYRVRHKLQQFWKEGIRGADFFMSAIGPAVEAFGRYARVEKLSEEPVKVGELLEYVRKVVSEFTLERILNSVSLGNVDAQTRFYLLWRWTYNHTRVPFDEARKLAQGIGVELANHWQPGGLVEKQQAYVRVPSPLERGKDIQFSKKTEFTTMIDALQYAAWLWAGNRQRELKEHLAATYGANEAFWQVAQAVSEALPEGDKERQILQGLLYGQRRADTRTYQEGKLDFDQS